MKWKYPFFLLSLSLLLGACGAEPRLDVRTFNLEHASGYEASELVVPYVFSDREGAPGMMSATPNAISVRETPDNLEKIARVLEDFDRPLPATWLRFRLIEADSFQEVDPAISEVVDELKELFRFQGYRLLGEALVTVAGGGRGGQEVSQRFLGTDETFTIRAEIFPQRQGTVRMEPVQLLEGAVFVNLLETSVSVAKGQTVVIGGARARRDGRSFILTVTAESAEE